MKKLIFGLLLCINSAFATPVGAIAVSDGGIFENTSRQCEDLFNKKKFSELDKFLQENDNDLSKDTNGYEMVSICLTRNFDNLEYIKEWQKQYPHSIYPVIVKQKNLVNKFFEIRGPGYISSIPKEQLMNAFTTLDNGATEMDNAKKLGVSPFWYQQRLKIAFLQQDKRIFFHYLDEAMKKYPNYMPIYTESVLRMTPNWGFSYEDLDNFARLGMKTSKFKEEVYASIYKTVVSPCCSNKLVYAGHFNQKLYRKGMYSILKKYPTQLNYNRFVQVSCLLGDVESAKYLYTEKMKVYVIAVWDPEVYKACYNYLQ